VTRGNLCSAFVAGGVFGLGLALSQMTDPRVVLAFLDVTGAFDPTLLFVMAAAVAVTVSAFPLVLQRGRPLLADEFRLPASKAVDAPLLTGAALFGIGWGLAGYCPGPALVALAGGAPEAWWFVPAMLLGGWIQGRIRRDATPVPPTTSALPR
jgi:uncharacterized membrane protein YedE/YeeE